MARTEEKDPAARLNYGFDWSPWLGSDEITASQWTVPVGLTQDSAAFSDTETVVWLSGGAVGATYIVTNRITTASGCIDELSFLLRVVER